MSPAGTQVHRRFAGLPGGDYVASGFALDGIQRWVRRRRPRRVLELGPGIGATTAALIESLDRSGARLEGGGGPRHVAVERSGYCLDHLAENLGADRAKVTVVEWVSDAPPGPYDLVVVDGIGPADGDPEVTAERSAAETAAAVSDLGHRAVVIVENDRSHQRRAIEAAGRGPWVTAHIRPWDGTPGYHLYLYDPTPVERTLCGVRRVGDRLWHPHGIRSVRRLVKRILGRELRVRSDVPSAGEPDDPSPSAPWEGCG